MISKDRISAIFFFFFSIYICYESLHLGFGYWRKPGAGFFPLWGGASLGVLSLFILFQSLKQKANDEESEEQASWRGIILCVISLVVYILFLERLGFIPTSFVFVLFYIKVIERKGWITAILTALAMAMASYGLFEICLQSQLPKGILEVLGI